MHLTPEDIATIAGWQSTQDGFSRDDPKTGVRVRSIADRLRSPGHLSCDILWDDGLKNYFVLFAYIVADVPSFSFAHSVEGLLIYLSACAPVGVVGRSSRCVDPGLRSHDPLEIADLIDPDNPTGDLEKATIDAIRSEGYEVLSAEAVSKPLPPGVTPLDYCDGRSPWDRVFHALFSDTD